MQELNKAFQVQDSLPKATLDLGKSISTEKKIVIERTPIELDSFERISTDTIRTAPIVKRVIPVKKTIPFIPVNDSIDHPSFNTLTGKYQFEKDISFKNRFSYELIPLPKENKSVTTKSQTNSVSVDKLKLKETLANIELDSIKKEDGYGFGSTDWMLGIIIFILIVFAWIRVAFGRYFQIVIQASYNYFAERRIQEEGNILRKRTFNYMNILFFIVTGLFSAQALTYYKFSLFDISGMLLFLLCMVFWILVYGFKGFVFVFFDFLFLGKGTYVSYMTTVFIYNKVLSFIMVPIVSLIPFVPPLFTPWMFKIGLFSFGILYIMRLFRGIQTGIKNSLSIFYLILYLCALEILPILVIFKMIVSFM